MPIIASKLHFIRLTWICWSLFNRKNFLTEKSSCCFSFYFYNHDESGRRSLRRCGIAFPWYCGAFPEKCTRFVSFRLLYFFVPSSVASENISEGRLGARRREKDSVSGETAKWARASRDSWNCRTCRAGSTAAFGTATRERRVGRTAAWFMAKALPTRPFSFVSESEREREFHCTLRKQPSAGAAAGKFQFHCTLVPHSTLLLLWLLPRSAYPRWPTIVY